MMVAVALFRVISLSFDEYTLLPRTFQDIDNPSKMGLVEASGYLFLGVVGLCLTCLYYGKRFYPHKNPRLTVMVLFFLLGIRMAAFLYMGARVLNLIQGCDRYVCQVTAQVALNLGPVLFDMWAIPHLLSLVSSQAPP
ncbi:hypothetical protein Pcinc_035157 [Petrolisthes cinctipes]|uniref:Uncharacterized protein n=1 Tax=Petrolisthes cinctipes TaxID=88211 RepID=A0AAE1BX75_PETCI|nr:hypothetical protein Pcinc_035157 [Petrolisthes cinctipes]